VKNLFGNTNSLFDYILFSRDYGLGEES